MIEADETTFGRLEREVQIASSMQCPHIVSVLLFGRKDANHFYLCMEWMEGGTLGDLIRYSGKVSAARIRELFAFILAALKFAHDEGVIHRDIKPANILLSAEDEPKLSDFGIARYDSGLGGDQGCTITAPGTVLGSPLYMSPEQCSSTTVDRRTDIYSLGAILCECLTGEPPFQGDSPMDVMYKHLHEPLDVVAERLRACEDPALGLIALKCLEKDPALRFQSVDEIQRAIGSDDSSNHARTVRITRKKVLAIVRSVCLVIAAIMIARWLQQNQQTTPAEMPTTADENYSRSLRLHMKKVERISSIVEPKELLTEYRRLMNRCEREGEHLGAATTAVRLIAVCLSTGNEGTLHHTSDKLVRLLKQVRAAEFNSELYSIDQFAFEGKQLFINGYPTEAERVCVAATELADRLKLGGISRAGVALSHGEVLLDLQQLDQAENQLKIAKQYVDDSYPLWVECRLLEACLAQKKKKSSEAVRILHDLEQRHPMQSSGRYLCFAGSQLLKLTNGKDGSKFFTLARALNETDTDSERRATELVDINLWEGRARLRLRDWRSVNDCVTSGLNATKQVSDPCDWKLQFDDLVGQMAFSKGEYEKAGRLFKDLEKACSKMTGSIMMSHCYWYLGSINWRLKQPNEAEPYFCKAMRTVVDDVTMCCVQDYLELLKETHRTPLAEKVKKLWFVNGEFCSSSKSFATQI